MHWNTAEKAGIEALNSQKPILDETEFYNTKKVLDAFRKERVNYGDFALSSGYGYGDTGRDKLERIYADIFKAEDALIRQQIVSGTHAITLALFAMLLPGDEFVIYGEPYDTLYKVIGNSKNDAGSLSELGISYKIHPFWEYENFEETISDKTKVLYIQRSKGYSTREALTIENIKTIINKARSIKQDIIVFTDNCYGEFCEKEEPLEAGADLIAGSLIKNPGGGIAPSGGYLAGRKDLIERASFRLTAPGIGKEIGPSLMSNVSLYQGLFMAPHIVAQALAGVCYVGGVLKELGYKVIPEPQEIKGDIVETIFFNDAEKLDYFCKGIQKYSAVDSHVSPEAWDMPGYENKVIMAAGGFTEGSSIELSCDGPMREPYCAYLQGGLSFDHIKIAFDNVIKGMFFE